MDDQDLQHLLNENLRLAKENHRMLTKLYKYQRWQKASKLLYWIALIAVALGAYYYVKPYIQRVQNTYSDITASLEKAGNTANSISNFFGGNKPKE